eukprot:Gb_35977 [translate_table: standard]
MGTVGVWQRNSVDFMSQIVNLIQKSSFTELLLVVKRVTEKCIAAVEGEKTGCLQDEIESAMTLLADFATRHDAIVITSLHLASLLQTLHNERAAIRKCFSLIVGCCLKSFNNLSPVDQHILAQLHGVLSRDRDATCRLRALTNLGIDLKAPAMFSNISKVLAISPQSSYFCKDTLEAVGHVLCSPCLKGTLMFDLLDSLLTEVSIAKLQNLLMMTADNEISKVKKFQKFVEQAFVALERHCTVEMEYATVIASCALISILSSLDHFTLPNIEKKGRCLLDILVKCMEPIPSIEAMEDSEIKKQIIKWAFKALAVLLKSENNMLEKEVKIFIKNHFLYLQENKVDGYLDCLYSLSNPLGIVRKILQKYEEQYEVLETTQPLKILHMYISFLGDISRNYDMACNSFSKCLRNVEMDLCKPLNFGNTSSQFDYLQQEELKAMEEAFNVPEVSPCSMLWTDAVARFAQMLLDGDSIPGCYVPFLRELVRAENLPTILRVAATRSLGQYMLASPHLAKEHKEIIEFAFHTEIPQIKRAALTLTEKLIISFPNEFLSAITLIESCLRDDAVKETAYCSYVRLLLEDKFKLEMLLTPICDGLCEANENIRTLIVFLLKKLLKDSGRSKIRSVLDMYNHTTKAESRHRLVEVFVENLLDNEDLQSDELASSILQLLTKGKNDAAFFASFLNPSSKVLNTMLSYLNGCPPKISVQGDNEAEKYLIKFVTNHKRQGPTAAEKGLITKLLDVLGSKPRRKRKGIANTEAASYQSLQEYEEAVESFKNCQITNCLWDILRMDI